MSKRTAKLTHEHWEILLNFMEENKNFAAGRLGDRESYKKCWIELVEQLNAAGHGNKSVEKWQKTWTDYKCTLKKKAMSIWKAELAGDHEMKLFKTYSPTELRVLSILGDGFYKGYNGNETSNSMCTLKSEMINKNKSRKRSYDLCEEEINLKDEDDHEYIVLRNIDDEPTEKRLHFEEENVDIDIENDVENDEESEPVIVNQEITTLLQTINDTIDHRLLGIQRSIDKLIKVLMSKK